MKLHRPWWLAYVIGGNYRSVRRGVVWSGWRPNIVRHVRRYYREGWSEVRTLRQWMRPGL